ncbi:hypothetical protein K461DRAFT_308300 [Myriangium duriaei CBS 260.36]|uniref:Uncharacterized protein n=1 Tax=Myriangium duriaei CBS 260.36 TaxID=1168546 RepID=A0A9P4J0Y7_9PEZI|nr:hypothetical protein K461DRAFT_308300 [Myriangium duriaei CBS 260.36]
MVKANIAKQPFRLLDLPPEIKMMIYSFAREMLDKRCRWFHVMDDGHPLSEEFLMENDYNYDVSRDLWHLALTCKEVNAIVLPLLYKGVLFWAESDDWFEMASPQQLGRFLTRCRLDLITDLCIELTIQHGLAKMFAGYAKVLKFGVHLDRLQISFSLGNTEDLASGTSAEIHIVCSHWQRLRAKEVEFDFHYDSYKDFLQSEPFERKFAAAESSRLRLMADPTVTCSDHSSDLEDAVQRQGLALEYWLNADSDQE